MTNKAYKILWVDDEIDLLKPHILFLEQKGYEVTPAKSGIDALSVLSEADFDLMFLDENMPGLGGLETLEQTKLLKPLMPVVMVTKSEEENLMNDAIGKKVADFLIKPVHPNQLLLTLKKLLHKNDILSQTLLSDYNRFFSEMTQKVGQASSLDDWKEIYQALSLWELDIEKHSPEILELFEGQKKDAERLFGKFVTQNYEEWISSPPNRPILSPDLFKNKVFPLLDRGEKVCFLLIDNFRWDQWLSIKDLVGEYFSVQNEEMYLSLLPTATQYARNAIFSGLLPYQIAQTFPELWVDENSEEGKNLNEEPLIATLLERYRRKHSFSYTKIYDAQFAEKFLLRLPSLSSNDLNVVVLSFVDMLSHARTDNKMIRELAHSPAAYRSITRSWFKHSTAHKIIEQVARMGYKLLLTTDHGSIIVKNPVKIIGDRNTTTNLRYKIGKNMTYDTRELFTINQPERMGLPKLSIGESYVFCSESQFLAYPNNYNYYVSYYRDTLQHGGISMEEMLVPIVTLQPK